MAKTTSKAKLGDRLGERIDRGLRMKDAPDAPAVRAYLHLYYSSALIFKKVDQHLARWGLSVARYAILRALQRWSPISLSALSESHLCVAGNMTALIGKLARDGLVRRVTDPKDRRVVLISVTAKGSRLIEAAVVPHRRFVAEMMSQLDLTQLDTLTQMLDDVAREAAGLDPLADEFSRAALPRPARGGRAARVRALAAAAE